MLAVFVLTFLVVADAPRSQVNGTTAVNAARAIGTGGAIAVAVVAVAISVTLQPLQFRMVQLMEGYWPIGRRGLIFRFFVGIQRRRYERCQSKLTHPGSGSAAGRRAAEERISNALNRLTERFPSPDRLLPTGLGNVLRSAEDRVGARYGIESVTIWPRLFPLLPAELQASIEDEVIQLDVSVRLAVTWLGTATVSSVLLVSDLEHLVRNPGWVLIVALLWLLAWLSYLAAIESAIAHGIDIEVAIDLHRHLVVDAMRLPSTTRLSEDRRVFKKLCRLFVTYDPDHGFEFEFRDPTDPPVFPADRLNARL
jgi:hypothetical protein